MVQILASCPVNLKHPFNCKSKFNNIDAHPKAL